MSQSSAEKIRLLLEKGVAISNPASIDIGAEVDPDKISGNAVVLYPGCRIYGAKTIILEGVRLGREAPVTIEDCCVGPDVALKGGYFSGAVFLEGASCGSGAHVRAGTIFEEQARCAHTVGLKQTILFPWVTLGSLINFCDIFMAGGTSVKDHSEVGSSYIHFNYTPNQDKATASLLGDVSRGVMLDRRPIFLGGQGGLVGPCHLTYGTIVAAGSICRKDESRPGRLIVEGAARSARIPFSPGTYLGIKRVVGHNVRYIANLFALRQWYRQVRSQFISDRYPTELAAGLNDTLDLALHERVKQFKAFAMKMPSSIELLADGETSARGGGAAGQQQALYDRWGDVELALQGGLEITGDNDLQECFLESIQLAIKTRGNHYLTVIQGLESNEREAGSDWLQSIVNQISADVMSHLPALQ